MEDLKHFTTEQLQQIIDKRKKDSKEKLKPTIIDNPDYTELRKEGQIIVDSVFDGSYHDDNDDEHFIYDTVMKTLFGPDFFTWFNKHT